MAFNWEKISPGWEVVQKFGRNSAVGTTFEPVTISGVYQTPQVSGAVPLRVKAGNAADASDGDGARTIQLIGVDATGAEVTETISTNGETAGAVSSTSWLRMYRAFVETSGTYASQSAGSHTADVVLETSGGVEWARISSTGFPRGQSEIGAYTVPLGKAAYIFSQRVNVDSNQPADVLFFQRRDILQTAAPYSAMRVINEFDQVQGQFEIATETPLGPFPALTDIGYMAKASNTASVEVDFEILLFNN